MDGVAWERHIVGCATGLSGLDLQINKSSQRGFTVDEVVAEYIFSSTCTQGNVSQTLLV